MKSPLNFLYTLYFNFRYLPLNQAVRLPIWVTTNLRECKLRRGQIVISSLIKRKQILIGGGGSPGLQAFRAGIVLEEGCKIVFHGSAVIAEGTVLRCDKDASIELGNSFYCNSNCYFRSTNKISFGNDCALGWSVTLNTSDGHPVWHDGEQVTMDSPIDIGRHVWLTSHTIIGKGASIADDCIVAQGAVVTKSFSERRCIIGGIPAKVVARNIEWHK